MKKKRARKAPWTPEEDSKLIALAAEYRVDAIDWHAIAECFGPERCAKRCRERWVEYINPELSTFPFTSEEDEFIVKQQKLLGNNWKEIARLLTTSKRSPAVVKTRWHQIQRRQGNRETRVSADPPTRKEAKKTQYAAKDDEEPPAKRQKGASSPLTACPPPKPSLVPLLINALTEQCPPDNTEISSGATPTQRPRLNSDVTDMETPRSFGDLLTSSSVLAQWEQQQSDALALHYRELHNAWAAKMLANAYQKQQQRFVPDMAVLSSNVVPAVAHWPMHIAPWQPVYMQSMGNQAPLLSQHQPETVLAPCDTSRSPEEPSLMPNASFRSAGVSPFVPTGNRFHHRTYFRG